MEGLKLYKTPVKSFKLTMVENKDAPRAKISSSSAVEEYMKTYFYKDDQLNIQEYFYLIVLDNSNKTIGVQLISMGSITGTLVDLRLVAKYALESLGTSIILVHNHPSGNLQPSQADKNLTEKAKKALDLLDIKVLDHIILTEHSFYSFADEGII